MPARAPHSTPTAVGNSPGWHRDAALVRFRLSKGAHHMTIRPRRTMLYMPGSNARALEKARTLAVDGVILDLEDAVAPDAKDAARAQVAQAVRAGGFGHREVLMRTNAIDTPWFAADFEAVVAARPDGVVVPKISTPDQIEMIGRRLLDT